MVLDSGLLGQIIHIMPYSQLDSVTSCSSGLRHGIDKAVLKVNVRMDRSEWSTVVVIQFRSSNSTEFRYVSIARVVCLKFRLSNSSEFTYLCIGV